MIWDRLKRLWKLSGQRDYGESNIIRTVDSLWEKNEAENEPQDRRKLATVIPYQKVSPIKRIIEENAD